MHTYSSDDNILFYKSFFTYPIDTVLQGRINYVLIFLYNVLEVTVSEVVS
jgi:hypothetical protein